MGRAHGDYGATNPHASRNELAHMPAVLDAAREVLYAYKNRFGGVVGADPGRLFGPIDEQIVALDIAMTKIDLGAPA